MISEDLNEGCDAAWNDISDAFGLNGNTIKEDYTETKIGKIKPFVPSYKTHILSWII